jgi:hypothetical protein
MKKKGHSAKDLLIVALLFVVLYVVVNTIGGSAWSISKAIGLPDWVIFAISALILLGGFSKRGR